MNEKKQPPLLPKRSTRSKPNRAGIDIPVRAGVPWTSIEDARLLQAWREGQTVAQIAKEHQRTTAGIEARLERHGKLTDTAAGIRK